MSKGIKAITAEIFTVAPMGSWAQSADQAEVKEKCIVGVYNSWNNQKGSYIK